MNTADIAGCLAQPGELDIEDYLLLEYYIECEGDPEHAVAVFCSEQSTVQWQRPGKDEDLRPLHAARLLELEVLEQVTEFSYGLGRPSNATVSLPLTPLTTSPWMALFVLPRKQVHP